MQQHYRRRLCSYNPSGGSACGLSSGYACRYPLDSSHVAQYRVLILVVVCPSLAISTLFLPLLLPSAHNSVTPSCVLLSLPPFEAICCLLRRKNIASPPNSDYRYLTVLQCVYSGEQWPLETCRVLHTLDGIQNDSRDVQNTRFTRYPHSRTTRCTRTSRLIGSRPRYASSWAGWSGRAGTCCSDPTDFCSGCIHKHSSTANENSYIHCECHEPSIDSRFMWLCSIW